MRVLLTGAAGFIGAHTVQHLLENTDWQIIALDSLKHKGRIERLDQIRQANPKLYDQRVQLVVHDLNYPLYEDFKADYIINMAAESHVDRSIEQPVPFVINNIQVALNTLEHARRFGCRKFIQISTDEVYGPMLGNQAHPEWDPMLPSNPYSASKAAQEDIAIGYWRTYQIPLIITNTMNNFGEMQDVEKFIPGAIARLAAGKPVQIHGNQRDIGSRFYLHARNHADALLFILKNVQPIQFPAGRRPARFNIVGEKRLDNLALARQLAELMQIELIYKLIDFHASRPGHDPHYGLTGGKLRGLGWRPPISFEDALAKTVRWTLGHPEWLNG